ncbi:Anti-sigma-K factor rskA [Mucilaginibacter lappiensis]|uniref:Regulator of SigK n=1 Tax=Mucilaginibacter lappiensis TaxID=354630 RepID=A0ABR6PPK0_9SPHI|nr:anti-sigma factor [Mucilaginibacter lappiensis]MBB6111561.1 anti-sigma-K factor RskA [Mucilaginibacter lappiensis]SIR85463.1 Anti-sigma-K factor rskA [Mucilaginibacter lappiensis]
MEDIRAYIETGILELYVLGDVTPDEKLQVEEMAKKHPAVKAELDEIGRSLELYARENAVEPSEALRDRVMGSILTNLADDNNFPEKPQHVNHKVVELTARKESNFYKYAFAASLALLVASTIALVNTYSRLKNSNDQLVAMQLQNQHFSNRVNLMDRELTIFRDPSFKLLKLQGTAKTPASVVTLAFSPAKQKVIIDMGNVKLPENDKDHQYQLWALVGGKPVDLGVFDAKTDSTDMKEMKSIALADAFAVTLEPKGGSVNPTMDQMVVLGKF